MSQEFPETTHRITTEKLTPAKAIHKVFDNYKGAAIVLPALTAMALQFMGVQASEYRAIEKKVVASIRSQARKGVLAIVTGKSGGVYRLCDMSDAKRKEYLKKVRRQKRVMAINREIVKLENKRARILNS